MSEQYDPNWVHNLRGLLAGKASFSDIMKLRFLTCFNELYASRAWQPIDTAPRDGTEILLYREDCGVMLGRWIACCDFVADGDPNNDFYREGDDEAWEEPDWFGADFIQGYRISNDGAPTHWQPLPEPPTNALRQGRKEAGE